MRRLVNLLLLAILLSSTYLDYWAYSVAYHHDPNQYPAVVHGLADAPAQYRIGVIDTANFISLHSHAPLRYIFTVIDLCAGLAAAFTLLALLRRSATYRQSSPAGRFFGELAFLALVEYYLQWLTWYQRPETLTSAALLALSYALISRSTLVRLPARSFAVPCLLLLITAAQSFVRADVIFALHLGILIACMLCAPDASLVLRRPQQLAVSFACVVLAVSIQYILMHKVFPNATYGTTRVVQLRGNLTGATGYLPFLLFMLPFFWTLFRVLFRKHRLSGAETGILSASAIFACLWSVLGVVQEVRIFLPFALLLAPVTVTLLMRKAKLSDSPMAESELSPR